MNPITERLEPYHIATYHKDVNQFEDVTLVEVIETIEEFQEITEVYITEIVEECPLNNFKKND